MGTEVFWDDTRKCVVARWKLVVSLVVTKQSVVFLFRFHSRDDMLKVLEGEMIFVFGKPLVLKEYDTDMVLGKNLFKSMPLWVKFPRLSLQF